MILQIENNDIKSTEQGPIGKG